MDFLHWLEECNNLLNKPLYMGLVKEKANGGKIPLIRGKKETDVDLLTRAFWHEKQVYGKGRWVSVTDIDHSVVDTLGGVGHRGGENWDIESVRRSILKNGYDPAHAVILSDRNWPCDASGIPCHKEMRGFELVDGHHRLFAVKSFGYSFIPALLWHP